MIDLIYLFYFASVLGLVGTVLNSKMYIEGFYFWTLSNIIIIYQSLTTGMFNLTFNLSIYIIMACYGVYFWKQHGNYNTLDLIKKTRSAHAYIMCKLIRTQENLSVIKRRIISSTQVSCRWKKKVD